MMNLRKRGKNEDHRDGEGVESRVIEIQRNCPDDDETPKTSIRIGEEKDLRGIGKGGEK